MAGARLRGEPRFRSDAAALSPKHPRDMTRRRGPLHPRAVAAFQVPLPRKSSPSRGVSIAPLHGASQHAPRKINDLREFCTHFALSRTACFCAMIFDHSEYRQGAAPFTVAKRVRLIVDKIRPVFMIVGKPAGSVMGEESGYGL